MIFAGFLGVFGLLFAGEAVPGSFEMGSSAPPIDFYRLTDGSAGKRLTWQDLEGRVVVIDFWATWCPPCKESIPHMNQLVKAFAGEPVTFLALTYEPARMLAGFLKKHPMDSAVVLDNDFATFKAYSAWGIPDVVVVNREGRIAARVHPKNLTEAVIREVLAGKMPAIEVSKPWHDPEGAEEYFRSTIR